jgi:hypothetical protein
MAKQKLTDKGRANSVGLDYLIHVVNTGDTSQSPEGSSYAATIDQVVSLMSGGSTTFTGGTVPGLTTFTNGIVGSSISATTYLNIGSIGTGTSVYNLGIDSNGFVVSGSTGGSGEVNTASNVGGTNGIFYQKSGVDLQFRSLSAGSNISITSGATTLTINSTSVGLTLDPYFNSGSGATINWNVSGQSTNYLATLTASTTLNLTNVRNGDYGTIILTQDGIGGRTITLNNVNGSTGVHKVANGGAGIITLTSNPNAIDIVTFTYNGSTMYWTVGNDYT